MNPGIQLKGAIVCLAMAGGALLLSWPAHPHLRKEDTQLLSKATEPVIEHVAPVQSCALPPGPAILAGPFQWSQMETNDLRVYVTRLRAAGCPEATVRDIILGIVHRRYEPRLKAVRRAIAPPFWQTLERHSPADEERIARQRGLRGQLEHERDAVIQDLLGLDGADGPAAAALQPDRITKLLDAFSESAQPRAFPILQRYDQLEAAVFQRCGGTLGLPEQAELRQLYRAKLDELRGVLSAEDLEQFELRASPLAHRLRTADLVGFSPNEQEFRGIFRLAQQAEASLPDGAPAEQSVTLDEAQLKEVLGDARFADYQRAQDLTYRRLVEFTGHFGLGTEVAAQVHDMREAVIQQVDAMQAESRLDMAGRQTALQQVRAESSQAVRGLLGDEAYNRYLSTPMGRWIDLVPTWTNGVVFRD